MVPAMIWPTMLQKSGVYRLGLPIMAHLGDVAARLRDRRVDFIESLGTKDPRARFRAGICPLLVPKNDPTPPLSAANFVDHFDPARVAGRQS